MNPPQLAEYLLRKIISPQDRDCVVGDLAEEFRERAVPAMGVAGARRWYWKQVLLSVMPGIAERGAAFNRSEEGLVPSLWQDAKAAFRTHFRSPGFTALAVLTLAAGLSVTAVLFTVIESAFLRPLPYGNGERIAMIWDRNLKPDGRWPFRSAAPANYADWKERAHSFSGLAAVQAARAILQEGQVPELLNAARVSADLSKLLGTEPSLGRWFLPEEDRAAERVVVLSHTLWRDRFGADPAITERAVRLDDQVWRVAGVMPEGFVFPPQMRLPSGSAIQPAELWMPLGQQTSGSPRDSRYLRVFGLLAPGATVEAADAELNVIAARLRTNYPATNSESAVRVTSLHEQMAAPVRPTVLMLMTAVTLLLLLTCANLSSLLMGRMAARRREMATRMALGASHARLIRQVVTENVLLALASGVVSVGLARWLLGILPAIVPADLFNTAELHLTPLTCASIAALSLALCVIFGFAPAYLLAHSEAQPALTENGRTAAGGRRQTTARGLMLASQIALAAVLLIGDALLVKSFVRLQRVDMGFDSGNLLTLQLTVPASAFPAPQAVSLLYRRIEQTVGSLPGVHSAATSVNLPFGKARPGWNIAIDGKPLLPGQPMPVAGYHNVSPQFLSTMRICLRRGRGFDATDTSDNKLSAVVNDTFARQHWPNLDPIGRRFRLGDNDGPHPWLTVVGVIADVRQSALDLSAGPEIYLCDCQEPPRTVQLVVRTTGDPALLASAVRGEITRLSRSIVIYSVSTMAEMIAVSLAEQRLGVFLLGFFATAALILVSMGLYAVLSYLVAQRTREIGIRIAIGASRSGVAMQVMADGARFALSGLAAGVGLAAALCGFLRTFLFDLSPWDLSVFLGVPAFLLVVAALAVMLPAVKAARIDPIRALHCQ